ncbi:hypothetical protein Leryth_001820 [Lithospermum erythrorhizon]|nr:hypothetical protein Leryth_001820 [Lithospermum erythrorhizon]
MIRFGILCAMTSHVMSELVDSFWITRIGILCVMTSHVMSELIWNFVCSD